MNILDKMNKVRGRSRICEPWEIWRLGGFGKRKRLLAITAPICVRDPSIPDRLLPQSIWSLDSRMLEQIPLLIVLNEELINIIRFV